MAAPLKQQSCKKRRLVNVELLELEVLHINHYSDNGPGSDTYVVRSGVDAAQARGVGVPDAGHV